MSKPGKKSKYPALLKSLYSTISTLLMHLEAQAAPGAGLKPITGLDSSQPMTGLIAFANEGTLTHNSNVDARLTV